MRAKLIPGTLVLLAAVHVAGTVAPASAEQAPPAVGAADERLVYTIVPGSSRATFYAHATGHDFSGTTTDVRGHARFGSQGPVTDLSGEVRVGAADLDTGIGKRNEEMRRLLETEAHPDLVLRVRSLTMGNPAGAPPAAAKLDVELEVRGVRKPLRVPISLEAAQDAYVARGEFPLDIRDFGIDPPRAMLFIRMDPAVRVEFEARFQRAH